LPNTSGSAALSGTAARRRAHRVQPGQQRLQLLAVPQVADIPVVGQDFVAGELVDDLGAEHAAGPGHQDPHQPSPRPAARSRNTVAAARKG